MSALSSLFISHSSRDHAIALEVGRRLRAKGYTGLFFDFDPVQGIPVARTWEQEMYSLAVSPRHVSPTVGSRRIG